MEFKNILNILKDNLNEINEKLRKTPLGDYKNDSLFLRRDLLIQEIKRLEALQNRSCESCKSCRQYSDLGLCDIQRGYVNMNLIKYCGRWTSKC